MMIKLNEGLKLNENLGSKMDIEIIDGGKNNVGTKGNIIVKFVDGNDRKKFTKWYRSLGAVQVNYGNLPPYLALGKDQSKGDTPKYTQFTQFEPNGIDPLTGKGIALKGPQKQDFKRSTVLDRFM